MISLKIDELILPINFTQIIFYTSTLLVICGNKQHESHYTPVKGVHRFSEDSVSLSLFAYSCIQEKSIDLCWYKPT